MPTIDELRQKLTPEQLNNLLNATIEKAKRLSTDDFHYFIMNVFSASFDSFVGGDYIKKVADHIQNYRYTMDVTGRGHFKSTRLYAEIMWRIFTDKGKGFEAWYFSYSDTLAHYHTGKIKELIRANPFFAPIVDNKPTAVSVLDYQWDAKGRRMTVNPSGLSAFKRGIHAEMIYIDDPFQEEGNVLTPTSIYKINETIEGQILPMVNRGGICRAVGCVGMDTLVPTKNGLVKISSLFPQNTDFTKKQLIPQKIDVLGKDGWDVTSDLFVNGKTKTNKITLTGGYSLECSQIHPLWSAPNHSWVLKKQIKWRKSSELNVGDWVALKVGANVFGTNTDLTVNEAYLYGLYQAEGSSETTGRANRITITNQDKPIIDFLATLGFYNTDRIHNRKNDKLLVNKMAKFGVPLNKKSFEKTIPDKLLMQTKDLQKAFLQGLYDGDGHSTNGGDNNLTVVLTSTSFSQQQTVQQMLLNFGIISHLNKTYHKAHYKKDGSLIKDSVSYSLKCTGNNAALFMDEIGFRLPYKNKKQDKKYRNKKITKGFHWVRIKSIEQSEALTVDFVIPQTHSFVSNGIVSHNTPQTAQDFFFDEGMQRLFATWITPVILDEYNKIVLWPEWKSFDDLVEIRARNEKTFNKEYMAKPAYSEDSYLERSDVIPLCTVQTPEPFIHHGRQYDDKIVVAGFDVGQKVHPSHLAVFVRRNKNEIIHVKDEDITLEELENPQVITWNDLYKKGMEAYDMTYLPEKEPEPEYIYDQIYSFWMEHWDYGKQVEYLNRAIEYFNISTLRVDCTRGELNWAFEQGRISQQAKPVVFTAKNQQSYASSLGSIVDQKRVNFVNEQRQISQLLAVNNNLQAISSPEGHGDSFWSIALALYEDAKANPRVRFL